MWSQQLRKPNIKDAVELWILYQTLHQSWYGIFGFLCPGTFDRDT